MNIDGLLKHLGVTKAELARRTGISPGNLNGALVNPTEETIRRIAFALDISAGELLDYSENRSMDSDNLVCPHCGRRIIVKLEK